MNIESVSLANCVDALCFQDAVILVPYAVAACLVVFLCGILIDLVRRLLEKATLDKLLNTTAWHRFIESVRKK